MIDVASILGPGGRIAARLPHYEHRPQQLAMAEAVEQALFDGQHLVVEAAPASARALPTWCRRLPTSRPSPPPAADDDDDGDDSTTRTQAAAADRHLHAHDQPAGAADAEGPAALAERDSRGVHGGAGQGPRQLSQPAADEHWRPSGRSACSRRRKSSRDLRQIIAWSKKTGDGSLSDLSFQPRPSVWDEVASDSSNCLGRKCPTYNECFYFRARRRVHNAQILVVNHALFFSDLALRRVGASILPDYDAVIFDEAHTLEAVAGDHLGLGVTVGPGAVPAQQALQRPHEQGAARHAASCARPRTWRSSATRGPTSCSTTSRWPSCAKRRRATAPAAIHEPNLLENRLSPALAEAGPRAARGRPRDRERIGAARFHLGPRPADGAGRRTDALGRAADAEARSIGSRSTAGRGRPTRDALSAAPIDVGPVLREHLFEKTEVRRA